MDEELDIGSTPPMGHPPTGQNSRGLNSAGLTSADQTSAGLTSAEQTSAGLTSADQISAGANSDDIATADQMSDGSAEQNPHNRMSVDQNPLGQNLRDWNTGLASAAPEGAAPFTSNLEGTADSSRCGRNAPFGGSDAGSSGDTGIGSYAGVGGGGTGTGDSAGGSGAGTGKGESAGGGGSGWSRRRGGPQPAWRDPSELPGVQRVLTGSFGQKLAAITDAARTVQAVMASIDADALSDPEIIALTQAVEQAGRPVDAARVRAATVVSHRSNRFLGRDSLAWRLGASRDLDLLTRLTRTSDAEMKRRVELGEKVCPRMSTMGAREPVFPIVAAALAAGELGVEVAANIVKALADYAVHGRLYADPAQVSFAEAALVEHATGSRYGRPTTNPDAANPDTIDTDPDTATATDQDAAVSAADGPGSGPVCRLGDSDLVAVGADHIQAMTPAWQAFLNPDGAAPKEATREAKSSFSFGKLRDGLYPLRGSVTPDLKGVMQNLFNTYQSARSAPRFPSAEDQQRIETGELVPGELLDDRTGGEKRADILRGILTQVAQDPRTPSMGGMPPTVMVHVNATDLLTGAGVGWIDGVDGPISMTTINQMIDNGGMQPIFFNGNGAVLGLGSTARCFTPLQRKAITARDGGCIIPGCTCPPQWCEVHHVEPWQYGGKTHVNNGVLLCWYHHHTITSTTGWKIRMVHGIPQVKAPHWVDPTGKWRTPDTHRAHDPRTRKPPD